MAQVLVGGHLVEPVVLLEVALDDLQVLRATDGSKVHAGVGDHSLDALMAAAHQFRQVRAAIEPIVIAAEQAPGLVVAGHTGVDQPMRHPRPRVGGPLAGENGVLVVGHNVAVGAAAVGDAVDDFFQTAAQLGVVHPAEK